MSQHFQDKVVIVTGAATGIGKETALAFARAGARVVLAAPQVEMLRQIAGEHPDLKLLPVATDITRTEDVTGMVDTALREYGRIDILVNNAGIGLRGFVAETKLEDAQRVMDVNFFGTLRCIQAVLPAMRRQHSGQIVNISSIFGVVAPPRRLIYSASKAAVRALSDALRVELRREGIDVISILPGLTQTQFFENQIQYGDPQRFTSMRAQSPAHVAKVILRACQHRRREVTLTWVGVVSHWAQRLAPGIMDWALRRTV